jgi:hypothetical protein
MTALDLRRAVVGFQASAVRAAVEAGLAQCPAPEAVGDPGFAELVTFWLVDPYSWE